MATGRRSPARALILALSVLAVAGCSQTMTQATTESALTGPLVLNSAASTSPAPATGAAPVAATTASNTAPAAPSSAQPLRANAIQAELAATRAAGGEFPNVNRPPLQPGGTVLPPAARAQAISQLEALRSRQAVIGAGAGGSGNPAELAEQAQTHGEAAIRRIEQCSAEGALENDPACAAD